MRLIDCWMDLYGVGGFWAVAAVAADNLHPVDTKACNLITRPRETFVLPLAMGLQPCAAPD